MPAHDIGGCTASASLDRRGFGSLAAAVGVACSAPWPAGAATDDPPVARRTLAVRSSIAFASALASAQPGDHIVLAAGTWSGNWTLARNGTLQQPIVIRSATKLGATMTGTITLAGQFTGVHSLRFSGNSLGVQIGNHDTFVLRCWFLGPRGVRATGSGRGSARGRGGRATGP